MPRIPRSFRLQIAEACLILVPLWTLCERIVPFFVIPLVTSANLRQPKLFGCFFSGARCLFRLRAKTFGITFPNRVTVVSSADKTLLITAPGFHELKVSSREQIRLCPRVPRLRQLKLQFLRTSTPSSRLFDRIITSWFVLVLEKLENDKSTLLEKWELPTM